MYPTMNMLEADAFYAMFWFEHIRTARKWPARWAWRDCRNRAGEPERVACHFVIHRMRPAVCYLLQYTVYNSN